MHSPTAALIGVGFLLVCFLLSTAMMTAIADIKSIAKMMHGSNNDRNGNDNAVRYTVAELCCAESETLIGNSGVQMQILNIMEIH